MVRARHRPVEAPAFRIVTNLAENCYSGIRGSNDGWKTGAGALILEKRSARKSVMKQINHDGAIDSGVNSRVYP